MPPTFVPLRRTLPYWPEQLFGQPDFLDVVGISEFNVTHEEATISDPEFRGFVEITGTLLYAEEFALALPALDSIKAAFLSSGGGFSSIPFKLVHPDMTVELTNVNVALRFQSGFLRRVEQVDGKWVPLLEPDGDPQPAEVSLNNLSLTVDLDDGDIEIDGRARGAG